MNIKESSIKAKPVNTPKPGKPETVSKPQTNSVKPSRPRAGGNAPPSDASQLSTEAQGPQDASSGGLGGLMSGMMDWAGDLFSGEQEASSAATPAEVTAAQSTNEAGSAEATATQSTNEAGSADSAERPQLELGRGRLLSQGRGGAEQITQLQEMLNAGGGQLEVDGVFGPRTAEAVRRFQEQNGLTVDGIVGPQTLAALNGGVGRSEGQGQTSDASAPAGEAATNPNNQASAETPENPSANSTTRLEGIPDRPENARGGRAFVESISHLSPGRERDQAVLNEILSGNIPDASRNLQELVINRDGREIRLNAMPDYLAIGSDEDNVRVPMTPAVAQAIADRTGTSLPTDRLVDDIHAQSRQLHMAPMSNNREGISTYLAHDQRIDGQLGSGQAPNGFVSGHKKDLVIPHRDGRVAIYGGRWENGGRIQSYSNVHHDGYEDYSHGARLVSQQIMVDGRSMRLEEALADPALRSLFTNQSGAFRY